MMAGNNDAAQMTDIPPPALAKNLLAASLIFPRPRARTAPTPHEHMKAPLWSRQVNLYFKPIFKYNA
jgi:hypothetical protein